MLAIIDHIHMQLQILLQAFPVAVLPTPHKQLKYLKNQIAPIYLIHAEGFFILSLG